MQNDNMKLNHQTYIPLFNVIYHTNQIKHKLIFLDKYTAYYKIITEFW